MSTPEHWTIYESPLGPLTLIGGQAGLTALRFPGQGEPLVEDEHDPSLFAVAARQLDEYFAVTREGFGVKLDLGGTPFQRRVWEHLQSIPCGATTTYGALARAVGRPEAVRAVAAAVGRTPVPIIVPCHRVVAGDGSLTGYRGGLRRKQALLDLERGSPIGLARARRRGGLPAHVAAPRQAVHAFGELRRIDELRPRSPGWAQRAVGQQMTARCHVDGVVCDGDPAAGERPHRVRRAVEDERPAHERHARARVPGIEEPV
jgi:methylated-DNA-[protein]-cysteine S-methyltransferase